MDEALPKPPSYLFWRITSSYGGWTSSSPTWHQSIATVKQFLCQRTKIAEIKGILNDPQEIPVFEPIVFCLELLRDTYHFLWRRQWHPTPVLLPGKSQGQRNLVGYGPEGHKELDTTEVTEHTCTHIYVCVYVCVRVCVYQFSSVSRSVVSDSLQPHRLQHSRPPCPSPTPGAHSYSFHQVSDAIQPSHPLLSPSPPTFNLSQHQGLFQWVSSSRQVAKVMELQLHSFQWIFRTDFFSIDWFDLLAVQGTLKSLLQHHSSKASILHHSVFF